MGDKPAIHQSSLATLYRCPRQYEFRYIEGIRIPPGAFLVAGTAVHAAIRDDLASKIEAGHLLAAEAICDAARDSLNAEWEKGVMLSQEEVLRGEGEVKGDMVMRAITLASLHHDEVAPRIEPITLEREWRLALEGYPQDLAGRYDIEEAASIRDSKTASKSPGQDAADTSLQLTTYAVARKYTSGDLPDLYLDYLVALKKPKAVTLRTRRDEEDVTLFLRRLDVAMRQLEAGVFPPCDPSAWWCSPRWCGYFNMCPYVKGRLSVPVCTGEES